MKWMLLLQIASISLTTSLHAGWIERKAEGWSWYEEREKTQKVELQEEKFESALEKIEKSKKELEQLLAEAILEPTNANVLRYMQTQKEWLGKSNEFSHRWQKVLLDHPELNPAATTYATAQYGRLLQKAREKEEKDSLIKEISKKYGLVLVYEGANSLSKSFFHVVRAFAEKHDWALLGISVDGVVLKDIASIEGFTIDKLNIYVYPAILAYSTTNSEIVPISFGLQSVEQIENNVFLQFNEVE